MSSSTDSQAKSDLVQKFLDGDLTADEQRQFDRQLDNAEFRILLAEYAVDHAQIYELARQAMLDSPVPVVERRTSRALRRQMIWWSAVAVLAVAALGLYLWQPLVGDGPAIGQLTPVVGHVHVELDGHRRTLDGEFAIPFGTTIYVGGLAGLARLNLDDGTEISLAGDTRLTCLRNHGQTKLIMRYGQLTANVAPQQAGRPLTIQTSNAEIEILGTRLALSSQNEVSEIGVRHGRVRVRRLSDGQTIELEGGQYAVASRRTGLQAKSWPAIADTWNEDFEAGLPDDWRYGQWLFDGLPDGSRGAVRASRRSSLEGIDSNEFRITLPKRWTRGLWEIHEDSQLSMTYKMSNPGWFQIMMGVRSNDLDPSYVGNYELQSSYWPKAAANEWRTVSVPLSAFRKTRRATEYSALPAESPRSGDLVTLLWFSTGDHDRGLVIDRIWIERSSQPTEDTP